MQPRILTGSVSLAVFLLGAISTDFDAWLKYRTKHPEAKYDWAVLFGVILRSLKVTLPGAFAVGAVTPGE